MPPLAILTAVLTYGPSILPVIGQIADWIKNGKTDVTPEDIQTLINYGKKSSADYLAASGLAIVDGKVVSVGPITPVAPAAPAAAV